MKNGDRYRLRESTLVEPLVNRWYAWPQLVSPLTAGFHLLNYQCKVMGSYLNDPPSHIRAGRDLKGGPFVDVPLERAGEVSALLETTRLRQSSNMQFARAVADFSNRLVDEATGQSIETYYDRLPAILKGHVELAYDYYNRPILRVLESMLYESSYYDESLQSLRISRLETDESRPFFMSTPRLQESNEINWSIPFAADEADAFFKLERDFRPRGYIQDLLQANSIDETKFDLLFTPTPLEPRDAPEPSSLRLRYFGHATVLIEWNGVTILTDPYIPVVPSQEGPRRFSYNDLPERIDYALITHNHHDHLVLESLIRLRNRISCLIVPKSHRILYGDICLKLMFRKLGFDTCLEFDAMDSVEFPGGEVIGVPFLGEHSDIAHAKIAYVVRVGGERILFAADSACLDDGIYENIRRIIGPVQTVFLGMECVGAPLTWHCGSLLPRAPEYSHDQGRRSHGCDATAGWKLLETLGARRFYNYAMGLEPWLEFLLGLGLSEESTQIRESTSLLRRARDRGFDAAERLCSAQDIHLGSIRTGASGHRLAKPTRRETTDAGVGISEDFDKQFNFSL